LVIDSRERRRGPVLWRNHHKQFKDADITYAELAEWMKKRGLKETEAGITMKLKRGTFAATFFLACLAAMELQGVALEKIYGFWLHDSA
jgi:hypothetical protein